LGDMMPFDSETIQTMTQQSAVLWQVLATWESIAGSHGKSINVVRNVRQGTASSGVRFF
jgi:hypothetical protein